MKRKSKTFIFLLLIAFGTSSFSQQNENVVIKYKKYQKFDLGDLSVTGSVVTPGDLSVKDRKNIILKDELYKRKKFEKKIINELEDLY